MSSTVTKVGRSPPSAPSLASLEGGGESVHQGGGSAKSAGGPALPLVDRGAEVRLVRESVRP